ncbi:uncharacterized protein F54H12.2-like [Fopius arisanus]|uniref:Uncharacterized protein F54H12.2-like n=1 Tax=Fopius arisanus TaxID=64838 RepID=A0A9R1U9R4_9HYME|nr:PREDICTED: uncharacterized protein F54H12.2-like [Fopius arisanus]
MSFLHSHSSECVKSELDLFTIPPTPTSIENSQFLYYNPVSTLSDDTPIEVIVPGHGEEYIDLAHTMIKIRAKILRPDGTAASADSVGPVNNFLHSMFNQVDVYFNQKVVTPPNNLYAYRAYIETLLNYGQDAKASHLGMALWATDTYSAMDTPVIVSDDVRKNIGLTARNVFTRGGRTSDMLGHLHCDVFNQDKFLMDGVELRVRLIRAKDEYCLMDDTPHNYKVKIEEAALIIRRVRLSPGILIAHAKTLAQTTAKYPLTRVEVKSFVMHSGILGETIDNAILGQLPKRIILGFVENTSFNGMRKKNLFNFQNFGINFLCMNVDGRQIPTKPLQPCYTSDACLDVEAFNTLFAGTGTHFSDHGNGIGRRAYSEGFCLFAFDLTPDLSASSAGHWNLVRSGSVRIEVRFDKASESNVNCLLYAEYDNLLEIDSTRQVIVDYSG